MASSGAVPATPDEPPPSLRKPSQAYVDSARAAATPHHFSLSEQACLFFSPPLSPLSLPLRAQATLPAVAMRRGQ